MVRKLKKKEKKEEKVTKTKKPKKKEKRVLLIHHSFPGQFGALARSLVDDGVEVVSLSMFPPNPEVKGVKSIQYEIQRPPLLEPPLLLRDIDSKTIRAEAAAYAMKKLKQDGFIPDVIYSHPGWGDSIYVKDIFPESRFGVFAEWYYNLEGQEVNFDPELPKTTFEDELRIKLKNIPFLYALNDADFAISPTEWQRSRFPEWAQQKISLIHEGLPIDVIKLVQARSIRVPDKNLQINYGDPVITYASRYLEPVRGFHIFMRALPKILKENKKVHVFIMGEEVMAGYGPKREDGKTWKQALLEELKDKLDMERIHFMGFIPYNAYLSILKMSTCHVYLTHPFILGWSFLEAAIAGIPIVASKTAPVLEFSEKIEGIQLIDFFDIEGLAEQVVEIINKPMLRFKNNLDELDIKNTVPRIREKLGV